MMDLEIELATFRQLLPSLRRAYGVGKYVLIHGGKVIDVFEAYPPAARQGFKQFGTQPFLVKQITAPGTVTRTARAIGA